MGITFLNKQENTRIYIYMHLYFYNFQLQSNGEESEINPLNVTWSCENKSERFKQSNMAAKGLTKVKLLYIVHIDNCYGICFGLLDSHNKQ
jgi:hypothetical protein